MCSLKRKATHDLLYDI
jgi:hypothetical protein